MERFLIVGLGNPGREYVETRHNVGFRCTDALAQAYGLAFSNAKHKALFTDGLVAGRKVTLVKPQTYMNLSGQSVAGFLNFYKLPLENLMVIHDDIDLPPGALRIRKKGGAGGQKGMRDIIRRLGTNEFARLRVGVGRPPGRMDPAAYVLQAFSSDELPIIEEVMDRAIRAVETWLREGVEMAMSRYNGVVEAAKPEEDEDTTKAPPADTCACAQCR